MNWIRALALGSLLIPYTAIAQNPVRVVDPVTDPGQSHTWEIQPDGTGNVTDVKPITSRKVETLVIVSGVIAPATPMQTVATPIPDAHKYGRLWYRVQVTGSPGFAANTFIVRPLGSIDLVTYSPFMVRNASATFDTLQASVSAASTGSAEYGGSGVWYPLSDTWSSFSPSPSALRFGAINRSPTNTYTYTITVAGRQF